jgi:hypothetical protein
MALKSSVPNIIQYSMITGSLVIYIINVIMLLSNSKNKNNETNYRF